MSSCVTRKSNDPNHASHFTAHSSPKVKANVRFDATMNLMELLFVTAALGVGAGLALAVGQKHGGIAALLGFVAGVASVFVASGVTIAIAQKLRRDRTGKQKGR